VAVDFGTKRIGLAISDPQRTIASPLATYSRQSADADATYFCRLVAEESIERFVVGLPVHTSGDESWMSFEARRFGKWLGETTGVAIDFFDERYTSLEADQLMAMGKLTRKRRKARRDMLAAQILLSAYLEAAPRGEQPLKPLEDGDL